LLAIAAVAAAFRILAAFDGSTSAEAALATALRFPWPAGARARGIVALGTSAPSVSRKLRTAQERSLHHEVEAARRLIAERWPQAEVVERNQAPVKAILAEARRYDADALVLGWRGHGAFRRLLAGSVSREVVRQAEAAVLVARTAPRAVRCLVVGFDASPGARRALRFVSRLEASRGILLVLASVVEPFTVVPPRRLPASIRATLRHETARLERERTGVARHKTEAAAELLERSGWRVKIDLRHTAPLEGLLEAAGEREGSVLIVGRTGTRQLPASLEGSVAQGVLNNARVPVLIVP
jgi:nucleotide-binding universal stress UspA family protein